VVVLENPSYSKEIQKDRFGFLYLLINGLPYFHLHSPMVFGAGNGGRGKICHGIVAPSHNPFLWYIPLSFRQINNEECQRRKRLPSFLQCSWNYLKQALFLRPFSLLHMPHSKGKKKGDSVMINTVSTAEARKKLAEIINKVAYGKEPVVLTRRGEEIAALISMEEFELIQLIEDHIDIEDARKALEEPGGNISAENFWKELGL
jgi:antitoxin Phd